MKFKIIFVEFFLSILIWLVFAIFLNRFLPNFFFVCNVVLIISILIGFIWQKYVSKVSDFRLVFFKTIAISMTAYSILTLGPLNVDRSISVWLLHQIETKSAKAGQLQVDELARQLEKLFFPKSGEFERRISEQLQLGNIEIDSNNHIKLTNKGNFQAKLDRLVATIFGLHRKYAG